jgi:hypothetical protein
MVRRLLVVFLLSASIGCATLTPPASLTGPGRTAFYANEVSIAFGTVQHAAIELNRVALLSEANTRGVVEVTTDVITTLKQAPEGWQAAAATGLERVTQRLDAAGKTQLDPYLHGAATIIRELKP